MGNVYQHGCVETTPTNYALCEPSCAFHLWYKPGVTDFDLSSWIMWSENVSITAYFSHKFPIIGCVELHLRIHILCEPELTVNTLKFRFECCSSFIDSRTGSLSYCISQEKIHLFWGPGYPYSSRRHQYDYNQRQSFPNQPISVPETTTVLD